jgi:hypothetical protein
MAVTRDRFERGLTLFAHSEVVEALRAIVEKAA